MKYTALILCLATGIANSTSARLGETQAECRARYGPAVPEPTTHSYILPGAVQRMYVLPGWQLQVAFVNDVATREHYTKTSAPPIITDGDVAYIFAAEQAGQRWRFRPPAFSFNPATALRNIFNEMGGQTWVRDDGALVIRPPAGSLVRVELAAAAQIDAAAKRQWEMEHQTPPPHF